MGKEPKTTRIIGLLSGLPFFSLNNLNGIENDRNYVRILFSRYVRAGKLIRLKKGLYTARAYTDNLKMQGKFSGYPEFIAGVIYQPSYLSMDYMLYRYNMLTEIPVNFISATTKKTACFVNKLGNYYYHKIARRLFVGFNARKENGNIVCRASKAKALFDYLYFRKNVLNSKAEIKELRLRLSGMTGRERKEFYGYVELEGSGKMSRIGEWIAWK